MLPDQVSTVEAKELVPGDIIIIQFGNIVPADVKLLGREGPDEMPMQACALCLSLPLIPPIFLHANLLFCVAVRCSVRLFSAILPQSCLHTSLSCQLSSCAAIPNMATGPHALCMHAPCR